MVQIGQFGSQFGAQQFSSIPASAGTSNPDIVATREEAQKKPDFKEKEGEDTIPTQALEQTRNRPGNFITFDQQKELIRQYEKRDLDPEIGLNMMVEQGKILEGYDDSLKTWSRAQQQAGDIEGEGIEEEEIEFEEPGVTPLGKAFGQVTRIPLAVQTIGNIVRKRLGKEKLSYDEAVLLTQQTAFKDVSAFPQVAAGATKAAVTAGTLPITLTTNLIKGLIKGDDPRKINISNKDINKFLNKQGLETNTWFKASEFITDLGISVASGRALVSAVKTAPALASFVKKYPQATRYMGGALEGLVDTQLLNLSNEGKLASLPETLVGIITGGLAPGAGSLLTRGGKKVAFKEAAARVIQGKTKDLEPALRAFGQLNKKEIRGIKGDKAFEKLESALLTKIKPAAKLQDEILLQDGRSFTIDDPELFLSEKIEGTDQFFETDYITRALDQLEKIFKKVGKGPKLARVNMLQDKLDTVGLSLKEMNDVSRLMSRNIRSFSAGGQPLTSITAESAENTRKGIKKTVRNLLTTDEVKKLDTDMSALFNTENLIAKNKEAVNRIINFLPKTGILQKLTAKGVGLADFLSGNMLSGAFRTIRKRAGGSTRLDMVDIQDELRSNLTRVRKGLKSLEKATKESEKTTILGKMFKDLGISDILTRGSAPLAELTTDIDGN